MIKPPFSSIKSPAFMDRIAQLDLVRPSTFIRVLLFETLPCDGSNSHGPQCFFPNHHQFFVFHGSNSSSPKNNTPRSLRWYTSQKDPKGRTFVKDFPLNEPFFLRKVQTPWLFQLPAAPAAPNAAPVSMPHWATPPRRSVSSSGASSPSP